MVLGRFEDLSFSEDVTPAHTLPQYTEEYSMSHHAPSINHGASMMADIENSDDGHRSHMRHDYHQHSQYDQIPHPLMFQVYLPL